MIYAKTQSIMNTGITSDKFMSKKLRIHKY